MKLKKHFSAKDLVKRMKRPTTECEKILANQTSDKEQVYRKYKEVAKLSKKTNN